ncbi:MAG: hypothetical protein KKE51_17655 [Gammaproteobacteria bacterium]|nr:hypothetical protein [Gammaproteobacteria bacterium]MBU1601440.1 hypothetical protein [Gammaproteobacteria bacterium]MBU2433635.1 hypothetical protein [Gammaproteobacteria bacterium]MBU2449827.1 hypothetical protein [Gammaproteobacteria bacterium]
MKKSYYFAELSSSYDAEIQDLLNDSEGKSALKARLKEKRQELASILPMIEFAPEMVAPVFYDAFSFANPKAMAAVVDCEPDDGDFPAWDHVSPLVTVAEWAGPYLAAVLAERAGEEFMVTAASLEFIRKFDHSAPPAAAEDNEDADRERSDDDDGRGDDDSDRDLAEAGDDWLGEQGFDSLKS